MKVGTRLAMTVTAFAFAAIPAVSLADGGSTHATAEKQCTSMRTSMGKQTFSEAFGKNRNDRNAFGKCVSKQQSQDTTDQANAHNSAEKTCRAQQSDPAARNAVSVRVELQADCFAGVWGHSAAQRTLLDPGDVEEGLRAAAAVGDDHIQKMAGRRVSPESFTHGSAAERARWFRRGLDTGSLRACDTFAID